jgi:hypothetical protein
VSHQLEFEENIVKRYLIVALLASAVLTAGVAEARRARVVVRRPRARVVVHTGFPIHRSLPNVIVRTAPVVRVAPRVYLAPVVFSGVVLTLLPPANARVWSTGEVLDRADGWTDFTTNVDRRGSRLVMEIEKGPAQLSFAEVVFENGDTQVVDFDEKVQRRGAYSLIDSRDGRKVDHVRVVARATGDSTRITLHLVS